MIRIAIGTDNRVKADAVKEAFRRAFGDGVSVTMLRVKSGVSRQPKEEEVFKGAYNRALRCYKANGFDFYVGIEGGIARKFDRFFTFRR